MATRQVESPSVTDYYRLPAVRQRIREYCGAQGHSAPTCVYVVGLVGQAAPETCRWETAAAYPPEALDRLCEAGADLSRSLWDRENLIVLLDIDYLNVDRPQEPFEHPANVFLKLEPVYQAVRTVLAALDLRTCVLMTGAGYHFTARVPLTDPVVGRLAALLAEPPPWFAGFRARRPPWTNATIDETHARASHGLGALVEHLGHLVVRQAGAKSSIPVVVNGTKVGNAGAVGRECASVDFSYVGDPLDARHLRVAFGTYQKHIFRPDIVGGGIAACLPTLVALPRSDLPLLDMLLAGRGPERGAALAGRADGVIPEAAGGIGRLLEDYLRSPLSRFHRDFYGMFPHPPAAWRGTYDRLDSAAGLLPCVEASLARPNDLLLQPAHLQHLTRWLLAEGWHPRHIAGLVHSRYARDHGWGEHWKAVDSQSRAEFDIRVFAGMITTGLDQAVDFNCRSAQEKELCPGRPCAHDLRHDRDRLFAMVR
jgi:hypothetical protein